VVDKGAMFEGNRGDQPLPKDYQGMRLNENRDLTLFLPVSPSSETSSLCCCLVFSVYATIVRCFVCLDIYTPSTDLEGKALGMMIS
jgi:hypothetical protein